MRSMEEANTQVWSVISTFSLKRLLTLSRTHTAVYHAEMDRKLPYIPSSDLNLVSKIIIGRKRERL